MQASDWSLKKRVFPGGDGSAIKSSLQAEQCLFQPSTCELADSLSKDSSPTES